MKVSRSRSFLHAGMDAGDNAFEVDLSRIDGSGLADTGLFGHAGGEYCPGCAALAAEQERTAGSDAYRIIEIESIFR